MTGIELLALLSALGPIIEQGLKVGKTISEILNRIIHAANSRARAVGHEEARVADILAVCEAITLANRTARIQLDADIADTRKQLGFTEND